MTISKMKLKYSSLFFVPFVGDVGGLPKFRIDSLFTKFDA